MIQGNNFSHLGIGSHADVSCAGKDAHILSQISGRKCEVKGFHDSYTSITDINYVNVAYKYHNQEGQEYVIELNQALDFTKYMSNSILCTNQARHNGVIIHDVPSIMDPSSPQCMTFPEENVNLRSVPALPVSKLTEEELILLPRLQLTSDDVMWDPNVIFGNEFNRPTQLYGSNLDYDVSCMMILDNIIEHHNVSSLGAKAKDGKCSATHLSKLWGIGLKAAERTLSSTTQLNRRDLRGNISRRVRIKVHQRSTDS